MRSVIYASSDAGGIDEQMSSCLAFCKAHDIRPFDGYGDTASTDNLREMVADAMGERLGMVVMAGPWVIPETERDAILSELVCAGASVVLPEGRGCSPATPGEGENIPR